MEYYRRYPPIKWLGGNRPKLPKGSTNFRLRLAGARIDQRPILYFARLRVWRDGGGMSANPRGGVEAGFIIGR